MSQAPAKSELWGHPKGLYVLFTAEMWERFSYYGMRALLVLTLVAATEAANPGFGMSDADALSLYGIYTGLVYFTPLIGGWLADNYLGQRRSILLGGILMAVAQFTLFAATPHSIELFYVGLGILIAGNGLFKPNISTIVGDLYQQGDARRDSAFSIFYMGINLGAFIAPLVTSTLGESADYGWRWGYFAAGVGMTLAVITQGLFFQRFLGDIGKIPGAKRDRDAAGGVKKPLSKVEHDRLRVILFLFVFVTVFWLAFEQAGGLMNIYADRFTDRMIGDTEVPAGYFQSLNPLFILLFAPVFSFLWMWLHKKDKSPDAPIKVFVGLVLTSIGFVFLILGLFEIQVTGKANMMWLVLAYMFHTLGELCISPVGLSLMTKLAPLRLASLVMGIWFLMPAIASYLAGMVGAFSEEADKYEFSINLANAIGLEAQYSGLLVVFGGVAVGLLVFAVILWLISGMLVNWMHGAERAAPATVAEGVDQELDAVAEHEGLGTKAEKQ
ncbi:MFS transporter [Pseudidiomarina tainanensis]|jgi:POT family proton-dependent oligopeptide transporter|uniref:Proton-dependent oligopeptide transporter, POT family n=2 Tax=Pseudidiomarina TaxID=2800384 RepID=A0A1I6GPX9_9GAMM|nr:MULTISPECIES: peptide MFS transporter [Pseudidiomarina]RZQ56337.1 MFS transporter [Pseudidiomarina tainanensis]SFR44254.1 proton-dependent oligopeptide transporter, POT family [Pseudidiomarina maritima]